MSTRPLLPPLPARIGTNTLMQIIHRRIRRNRYSLDDTLALCQERGVADATAYLLERKGDVVGALSLALRTLNTRLSSLRLALQEASLRDVAAEMAFSAPVSGPVAAMEGSGGASAPTAEATNLRSVGVRGGGPRAGTAAWARWASKVALEGLQEVRGVLFYVWLTIFCSPVCVL